MKSGFVVVAGRPNVGKSTLVNALCGEKIAITSNVPNTTRRRLFGVANGPDYQLALVDLPGFQRPMDALTERMQKTVDASFEDVDAVLLVVDARAHIGAGDRFVARRVFGLEKPVVIALNKIDRLKPAHIVSQMKTAATLGDFHALHPVSAKTKDGVDELRSDLVFLLPEGPAYFPEAQTTDLTLEERVAEVIREKALHLTREEVPHAVMRRGRGDRGPEAARARLRRNRVAERNPRGEERARWCARSERAPGRRSKLSSAVRSSSSSRSRCGRSGAATR